MSRHRPAPDHPWRRFRLFKKGVLEMSIPAKQMEVERVMNLVRAFGWELQTQEMGETSIKLTIIKKLSAESLAAGGAGGGGTSPA